jgi:hypothetical protein
MVQATLYHIPLRDTREKRLRMRAYQNVFLEFKRVLLCNLPIYKNIRRYTFLGQRYCINEEIMK